MPPDGHVFISYSRRDGNEQAEKVEQALRAKHFGVWRDIRDLKPEQDFTADIEIGIEAAAYVVVCITKDTKRNNSFVRREIQYALAVNKPVIPLRFEDIPPHVSIINNEWVDFHKSWDSAFRRLIDILSSTDYANQPGDETPDPFKPYLQYLLQRVTDYLKQAVIRKIDLYAEAMPEAVPEMRVERSMLDLLFDGLPIGSEPIEETPFNTFSNGFQHYDGRVLLLGEPGAGKTVTLMAHTRDAIAARLDDPTLALPLLGLIATWNARPQPSLAQWLGDAYPGLLNETEVQTVIASGKALLFLDGLDELGSVRQDETTKESYDPRLRFIDHIPQENQIIVTCRVKDYEELGVKIPLNGAITLKPLDDAQMQLYLQEYGDLWDLLQTDEQLRDVARTPLLLSYFAFAVQGMNKGERAELTNLKDAGDIRDKIFEFYVEKRYKHEEVKYKARGEAMPYDLEQVMNFLKLTALEAANTRFMSGYGIVDLEIFTTEWIGDPFDGERREIDPERTEIVLSFIHLCEQLNLLVQTNDPYAKDESDEDNSIEVEQIRYYKFIHLLLFEYFAYTAALEDLKADEPELRSSAVFAFWYLKDFRAIEHLIFALSDHDDNVRFATVQILGRQGDLRAVKPIMYCLTDKNADVRKRSAWALGILGDRQAVSVLIRSLIEDEHEEVRLLAAESLGNLGDTKATEVLVRQLTIETKADVRRHIALALEKFGMSPLPILINAFNTSDKDIRWRFARTLGDLGNLQAIEPLYLALSAPSSEDEDSIRYTIAEALSKLGIEGLEALTRAMSHPDKFVRMAILYGYEEARYRLRSEVVELIINALADEDWLVREEAARKLGEIGDLRAVEPLTVTLRDTDANVRLRAADALKELGDARAVKALIATLYDADRDVRRSAAGALGQLGDAHAVEALIMALSDTDIYVRDSASYALNRIGTPEALAAVEAWRAGQERQD